MVDENGKQTITNDGATVMKLLDIVHPAARILTDIARSQDAEVGDGTTSVVVLAGEILKEVREYVDQGVSSQVIIKGLRRASTMAVNKIREIAVDVRGEKDGERRETLIKLAATAMSSKLIHRNADFFTKSMLTGSIAARMTNKKQWSLMQSFLWTRTISTTDLLVSRRSPVVHSRTRSS